MEEGEWKVEEARTEKGAIGDGPGNGRCQPVK